MTHDRVFNRWTCVTHSCGSYNPSNLGRHEIPSCEIVYTETVGVVKPKTWGGFNGDVSRKFLKEWNDYNREKQIQENAMANWEQYKQRRLKQKYKKYDKKPKGIFQYKRKKD